MSPSYPLLDFICFMRSFLQGFNFMNYLKEEIWQYSRRRNEMNNSQEQISGPFRNRVWKFLSIPQYFESVRSFSFSSNLRLKCNGNFHYSFMLIVYALRTSAVPGPSFNGLYFPPIALHNHICKLPLLHHLQFCQDLLAVFQVGSFKSTLPCYFSVVS